MVVVLARILFWDRLHERIDQTTITLLLISLIIILIPIENIKSLKAGGVELELNYPQIEGVITSLNLNLSDNEKIKKYLQSISNSDAKLISGSKVLWIDDKPHNILAERRLFRALGVSVVAVSSLQQIKHVMKEDNDFDLIISDIQWRDKENPNKISYGGIEAIRFLREGLNDEAINATHVIFYTAYQEVQIEKIDKQTGFLQIENQSVHQTVLSLLQASVNTLVETRKNPIKVMSRKKAT